MKKNKLILALLIVSSLSAQKRSIPADTIVSTNHTTKIKGAAVENTRQAKHTNRRHTYPAIPRSRELKTIHIIQGDEVIRGIGA